MRLPSVWKFWNRPARPSAPDAEVELNQAWGDLREAPGRTPSWEKIERLILTGRKNPSRAAAARTGMFILSRKLALVGSICAVFLVLFFAVPFSQTNQVGSTIQFEFDPPLTDPSMAEKFEQIADLAAANWDFGITSCKVEIGDSADGMHDVTFVVLTEEGMATGDLEKWFAARFAELDLGEVSFSPITKKSTGSIFSKLAGKGRVVLEMENGVSWTMVRKIRKALDADTIVSFTPRRIVGADDNLVMLRVGRRHSGDSIEILELYLGNPDSVRDTVR